MNESVGRSTISVNMILDPYCYCNGSDCGKDHTFRDNENSGGFPSFPVLADMPDTQDDDGLLMQAVAHDVAALAMRNE